MAEKKRASCLSHLTAQPISSVPRGYEQCLAAAAAAAAAAAGGADRLLLLPTHRVATTSSPHSGVKLHNGIDADDDDLLTGGFRPRRRDHITASSRCQTVYAPCTHTHTRTHIR